MSPWWQAACSRQALQLQPRRWSGSTSSTSSWTCSAGLAVSAVLTAALCARACGQLGSCWLRAMLLREEAVEA
ncbi:hypothetical protein KUF71_019267, partial [Frankliniella fusca]